MNLVIRHKLPDDILIASFDIQFVQTDRLSKDPKTLHQALPDYCPIPRSFFEETLTEPPYSLPCWDPESGQKLPTDHIFPEYVDPRGNQLFVPMDPSGGVSAFAIQIGKIKLSTESGRPIESSNLSYAILIQNSDHVCLGDGGIYPELTLVPEQKNPETGSVEKLQNYTVASYGETVDTRNSVAARVDGPQTEDGVVRQFYFSTTSDSYGLPISAAGCGLELFIVPLKPENIKCTFANPREEVEEAPDLTTRSLSFDTDTTAIIQAGANIAQRYIAGTASPADYDIRSSLLVNVNILPPEEFLDERARRIASAPIDARHDARHDVFYTVLPSPVDQRPSLLDHRDAFNILLRAIANMTPLVYCNSESSDGEFDDIECLSDVVEMLIISAFSGRHNLPVNEISGSEFFEDGEYIIFVIRSTNQRLPMHVVKDMVSNIAALGNGLIQCEYKHVTHSNIEASFSLPKALIVDPHFMALLKETYNYWLNSEPQIIKELISQITEKTDATNQKLIDLASQADTNYEKLGGHPAFCRRRQDEKIRTGDLAREERERQKKEDYELSFETARKRAHEARLIEEINRRAAEDEKEKNEWDKINAGRRAMRRNRQEWIKTEEMARLAMAASDIDWYSLDDEAPPLSPKEAMDFLHNYFSFTGLCSQEEGCKTPFFHYLLMAAHSNFPTEDFSLLGSTVSFKNLSTGALNGCTLLRMSADPRIIHFREKYMFLYIVTDTGLWYYNYSPYAGKTSLERLNFSDAATLSVLRGSLDIGQTRYLSEHEQKEKIATYTGHSPYLTETYVAFDFNLLSALIHDDNQRVHYTWNVYYLNACHPDGRKYNEAGLSLGDAVTTFHNATKTEFLFHPKVVASAQFISDLLRGLNRMVQDQPHLLQKLCKQHEEITKETPALMSQIGHGPITRPSAPSMATAGRMSFFAPLGSTAPVPSTDATRQMYP
jgi:hypothetical protein